MVLSNLKAIEDRQFQSFCETVAGEVARRVCLAQEAGAPPLPVEDVLPENSEIFNLSIPLANVEVSQVLPANTKKLLIRSRGNGKLQFSFTSGDSGVKYITIEGNAVYSSDKFKLVSGTLYIQSNKINTTVEIHAWS